MVCATGISLQQIPFAFSTEVEKSLGRYELFTKAKADKPKVFGKAEGWCQLAMIVGAISVAMILSSAAVLPAAVLYVGKVSILTSIIAYAAAVILGPKESGDKSEYSKHLAASSPFSVAVIGPIIEEVLFRGILQGGLEWALAGCLPAAAFSILGTAMPVAALVALVVSSVFFGGVHLGNPHEGHKVQALITGLIAFFTFGRVFYLYGLWASCLSHIMHNTVATAALQISLSSPDPEKLATTDQPMPVAT